MANLRFVRSSDRTPRRMTGRTLETLSGLPAFQAGALDRAMRPLQKLARQFLDLELRFWQREIS